jgi:ribosome-associated heat shock protein Hsp15
MSEAGRQRIDKWLWFARFAKSRTLAQRLVEDGRVRVNRDKVDAASRLVRTGDVLTLRLEGGVKLVRIVDPGTRRGPAIEARTLYEDITPPAETVDGVPGVAANLAGGPRPTKRDRREMDAFRTGSGVFGSPFSETEDD